ncbi:chromate efflux transporter [Rhodopseudomonas boonkerdii]|uniref:chromate efflux transporter n=1 Tax=Rhodopseudomonas boonkerdii TaxID=475937 RepID=UPI001E5C701C|nr:chromate efflux transporter [Rhodopseudomonas boonkerdii]UGV26559.1 chromate efflux transporter [Rhodopseudomonas boonkerdii]
MSATEQKLPDVVSGDPAIDPIRLDPIRLHGISFSEALRVWLRISLLSFGGPAGQIAVMHRIVVEEKNWISEARFLHALNYCMLLPGPEAQQMATYMGWLLHRTVGGIVAGTLFILPGVIAIMTLSYVYAAYGNVGFVAALFFGLKSAVLAIVIEAVIRIGRRALGNPVMYAIAGIAFVAIFFFAVPFPAIILTAAIIGLIGARLERTEFATVAHGGKSEAVIDSMLGDGIPDHAGLDLGRTLRVLALWLALWLVPVAVIVISLGWGSVFSQIAVFFSKLAMVTFGGAYAVLAYVAQQAADQYHWVTAREMLDGLGMAETTPGPLIMVVQFVAFMAAFRDAGGLSPMLAGTLGGLLATWVTFTPCFLWIFVGAPYIEALRGNRMLAGALAAITAAVVGVILNLSIWFALHTLFRQSLAIERYGFNFDAPVWASVDPAAVLLSAGAAIAILRFKLGMLPVLGASCVAGILLKLAGLI